MVGGGGPDGGGEERGLAMGAVAVLAIDVIQVTVPLSLDQREGRKITQEWYHLDNKGRIRWQPWFLEYATLRRGRQETSFLWQALGADG